MNEHRAELVIGIVLLLAPWILGFADISVAKWVDVLAGLVLILMNAWMLFGRAYPAEPAPEMERKKSKKQS